MMQLKGEEATRIEGRPLIDNLTRMANGTTNQKFMLVQMLQGATDPRLRVLRSVVIEKLYKKVM